MREPRRGGGWDEVWPSLVTLAVAIVLFIFGQWLAGLVAALFLVASMAESQRDWAGSERAGRLALWLLGAAILAAVVFVVVDREWPLVLRLGALAFLLATFALWRMDRKRQAGYAKA